MKTDKEILIKKLKNASTENTELFRELLIESFMHLEIDSSMLAARFGTSLSTIQRWKSGVTSPHPAFRKAVFAFLASTAENGRIV